MTAVPAPAVPAPAFAVEGAERAELVATPTIAFALRIDSDRPVRSILLDTQIQIAARRRAYDDTAKERLFELFGPVEQWGRSLRTLLWARVTHVVPGFSGSTVAALQVPCSYDLEVAASRYFGALADGEVPLEFLFAGTVFYGTPLQAARISWNEEAEYRLPVRVWREAMDAHFPGAAWLRLSRDRYDRLSAYRSRHALGGWDEAIDALLEGRE